MPDLEFGMIDLYTKQSARHATPGNSTESSQRAVNFQEAFKYDSSLA